MSETLEPGDLVRYDDSPGEVVSTSGGTVTVAWDDGATTAVSRSDLVTEREYREIING